ncbi:MAG: YggS family pyridoxal phosphate-dependent enzyme [Terricaulis sp.]|nr:YggS family pyridoxal phosphate-dependent enzyme [Terricaulis sp.]
MDASILAANLAHVRERMVSACARAGRDSNAVRLIAVTKTHPASLVRAAYAAGLREIGENKVQEAREKQAALSDLALRWHVIGHLQTNKAKYVARFAHAFHALDSLRLAAALDHRLELEGRELDVYVQVNTSGEASKFGIAPEEAPAFAEALAPFTRLKPKGLMTLALFSKHEAGVRACFQRLRDVRDDLCLRGFAGMAELSMGMSGDFEIAIEEGASIVRVGQALFGPRALPDAHYWPGG